MIEVGPGTGTLTEEFVARAGRMVVVEIDRNLASLIRQRFGCHPNFAVIEGDALAGKHRLNVQLVEAIQSGKGRAESVKLVANLPYNIASPLVIEMLIAGVELLAFTVQRSSPAAWSRARERRLWPALRYGATTGQGGGVANASAAGILAGAAGREFTGPSLSG